MKGGARLMWTEKTMPKFCKVEAATYTGDEEDIDKSIGMWTGTYENLGRKRWSLGKSY